MNQDFHEYCGHNYFIFKKLWSIKYAILIDVCRVTENCIIYHIISYYIPDIAMHITTLDPYVSSKVIIIIKRLVIVTDNPFLQCNCLSYHIISINSLTSSIFSINKTITYALLDDIEQLNYHSFPLSAPYNVHSISSKSIIHHKDNNVIDQNNYNCKYNAKRTISRIIIFSK